MAENFKSKKRATLFAAAMLLLAISFFFFGSSFDKMLITLLVGFAYFTGIISIFFGAVFSLLAFLAALPVISTIQAYIAFILARINYIVFRIFFGRILRRTAIYRGVEERVKNSSFAKRIGEISKSLLQDLGLRRPRRMKVFEVTTCQSCQREVPIDGALCPYCGEHVKIDPDSWVAIFQLQFADFYSIIKDLTGLKELRKLSKYRGHGKLGRNKERLRHSYWVSWISYKIAQRLSLDKRLTARAGLLHDIGYEPKGRGALRQILSHARESSKKISGMGEDEKISGIVSQHMFPLSPPPSSMESGVVWFGDKIATVAEFFRAESLFQGDELWRKIKETE
ncbi:MAG: HD domain-containing protein [Candidatus Hydrothermarchaeaceae archaeon]